MTTLRALSRAFANGTLDRDTYRVQRRELLQKIASGDVPVVAFQAPEPEPRTVFPYNEDDGDTTQEIIAPVLNTSVPIAKRSPLPVIAIVVALAAVGFALHRYFNPPTPPTPTPVAAPREVDVVEAFVTGDTLSGVDLTKLGQAWASLDAATQEHQRTRPSMSRLTQLVLEEIKAERALFALGEADEALAKQSELLDFMDSLGVTDERLARAREEWAASRDQRQLEISAAAAPAPTSADTPAAPDGDVPSDEQALPSALAVTQSDDTPPAESGGTETASAAPANETIPAVTAAAATRPAASAAIAAPATAQSSPSASAVPPAASQAVSATKPDRRTNCKVELARTRRPYCIDLRANNKGPALVVLPSGQFEMGGDGKAEQPKHKVDIAHPFAIGMFEVSSAELNAFCKASGQDCPTQPWDDATLPAVGVSWDMARAYTVWLSEYYGARYRLPSEAEWEYAARGGTQSLYAFGDEILPTNAHFSFKSAQDKPLAANDRSLNHNPFRLYHMLGNVREWVADAWTPDHSGAPADGTPREGAGERVVRGGSYADAAAALQSAARQGLAPTGDRYTGFRVVRELD